MGDDPLALPHGPGFRFVDTVVDCEPGVRGTFTVRFPADHPILQAHFPGRPLVPGVVLVEALAQAAGCVWGAAEPGGLPGARLADVGHARFRAPVGPDVVVTLEVTQTHALGAVRRFDGTARVGAQVVCACELTLARDDG